MPRVERPIAPGTLRQRSLSCSQKNFSHSKKACLPPPLNGVDMVQAGFSGTADPDPYPPSKVSGRSLAGKASVKAHGAGTVRAKTISRSIFYSYTAAGPAEARLAHLGGRDAERLQYENGGLVLSRSPKRSAGRVSGLLGIKGSADRILPK